MTKTMGELTLRTGLSRQWISRMAALGEVPSAKRKPSGRWQFINGPALDDWIECMGRKVRIRRRKRLFHQDEAEVRRLERKASKLLVNPNAQNARRRLTELREQIAIKQAAVHDYVTTRDVARAIGRSRRWVTGTARWIPGARMNKNQFVYPKSEALSEWIHQQRRLHNLERKLTVGKIRFAEWPLNTVLSATFRYERIVVRELNRLPFGEWPKSEQQQFEKSFRRMAEEVQRAVNS